MRELKASLQGHIAGVLVVPTNSAGPNCRGIRDLLYCAVFRIAIKLHVFCKNQLPHLEQLNRKTRYPDH